jgi:hypothetical protein
MHQLVSTGVDSARRWWIRVAAIGAVFFAAQATLSARLALFASLALFALSIAIFAAFLSWMRRAAPETSSQNLRPINDDDHNPGD